MDELTLNCWIRSENPKALFRVKISKTDTVMDLQEVIKNKEPATFRDVAAYNLDLYKPKTAISEPFKEHLSKFILSEDGELLEGVYELSDYFPEPPPMRDIHVIVDAPSTIVCWLRGVDFKEYFQIPIQPNEGIERLMPRIKDAQPQLRNVSNNLIRLYKISGGESELRECLNKTGGGERLQELMLARNFLDVPVLDPLRVVIEVPAIGRSSPTFVEQKPIARGNDLEEYRDIFVKVMNWSEFEESDIQRNSIEEARNTTTPDFVATFERKLDRTPHFPVPIDGPFSQIGTYFGPSAEDECREEMRDADLLEVIHTAYIALGNWQKQWQDGSGCLLKEYAMDLIFFGPFIAENRMAADLNWPITVVVKREGEDELRKYFRKSDFLISNFALPRLLVEVNSTPQNSWPTDLIRMLTTGAFIVRFANNFVSTFNQEKNFILCAFFIWDNGIATRYTLFQQRVRNDNKVYYKTQEFPLTSPLGRVQFVRHLYSLCAELDQSQDQAAEDAVMKFCEEVKRRQMKSMHTKPEGDPIKKRTATDHDDPAGGGGYATQLRAHGYEVEPKVSVDDSGSKWWSLSKMPDHILTVCRPTNRNKMFIAKKVREKSNEPEILRLLNTIPLQSDHVISLIDSFNGWVILPKMNTVADYVDSIRNEFEGKVSQVCRGLIEGVAYLHKHHIAHRDIKPENLVVDENFTLKIIDFDVAVQVKDEDEEVDMYSGTDGWMAPEVGKKLRHSPIKADRWSCGRVFLLLLNLFCKEDISLKAFAMDLIAHDPKKRPSLLEWGRYLAPDSGNIGNSDAGKTSQRRRDRVEDDGEITNPPNVKKQRLD